MIKIGIKFIIFSEFRYISLFFIEFKKCIKMIFLYIKKKVICMVNYINIVINKVVCLMNFLI